MKNLRGAAPKNENNDDCHLLAPFVMTLFDGEANETEARRARAHLLVCQSCANRWLDWNRSRDLLRNASVATPPPQLMWRILMACRLAAAPQRALTSKKSARTVSQVAAPANFSAQILARTTRASTPAPVSASRDGFGPRFAFSPLKLSAMAVPALTLWMMVLQRDVWIPAPVAPEIAETSRAFNKPRRDESRPTSPSRAALRPASGTISQPAQEAAQVSAPTDFSRSPVADSDVEPVSSRPSRLRAAEVTVLPSAPLMRAIEASFGFRSNAGFERAVPLENAQEERDAAQIAEQEAIENSGRAARRAPRRASRVRLAALSNPGVPRLRATRWQSAPVLSTSDEAMSAKGISAPASLQLLRVSLPNASAPQPARLLAEFDADDESVDEIRSVVDDFRATLGPDETGTETTPADGIGIG